MLPYVKYYNSYAFEAKNSELTPKEKEILDTMFQFPEKTHISVLGCTTKKVLRQAEGSGLRTVIIGLSRNHYSLWKEAVKKAVDQEVTLLDAGGGVLWNPEALYL